MTISFKLRVLKLQENAAPQQAGPEEQLPGQVGPVLAGRQTLEVLSGAESIADALELAAAEAERQRVRAPCMFLWVQG